MTQQQLYTGCYYNIICYEIMIIVNTVGYTVKQY